MAVYEPVRHQKVSIWTEAFIWQYMDRSVTKKILYGPQKRRSIYYFFGDGPVHILPYDPQCHELFAIYDDFLYSETNLTEHEKKPESCIKSHFM